MKKLLFFSVALFLCVTGWKIGLFQKYYSEDENTLFSSWKENPTEAFLLSQQNQKPLCCIFLDSDIWSQKFLSSLHNVEFLQKTGKTFLFCVVDEKTFPDIAKNLQQKYQISKFPNLVLLNFNQEKITSFGFLSLTSDEYADQLLSSWKLFKEARTSLLQKKDLEAGYKKAKTLGWDQGAQDFLLYALQQQRTSFFLKEHYKNLLSSSSFSPESQTIRKEIEALDLNNHKKDHLELALIDFNILAKTSSSPQQVLSPLISYIADFGKQDPETWRLHLLSSEYFLQRGDILSALDQARLSYKSAPIIVRASLKDLITYLKKQDVASAQQKTQLIK